MSKNFTQDFTQGKIMGPLVKFGLPLVMANLLQIVYNMVDMIVVGNVCGKVGLSGVVVGGQITDFFTVLVIGFSNAAQVIISQLLGAKQKDKLGRFVGTFSITLLAAAATNTVLALLLRRQILIWLNTPVEAFDQALAYSVVSMSGIVFVFGYNAVSAIMRGLGDSKRPFAFIAIAAVTNIILDLVFVAGIGLGPMGAALATVLAQAISFVIALIFLFKNKEKLGFEIHFSDFKMDWELFRTLIKLGVPMAIKSGAVSFSMLFVNSFIYSYGIAVTTVTGIGSKLNQIGNLISTSFNTAGATMVGQNIGAQTYNRVHKIMLSVWLICFSSATIMSLTVVLFPTQVFSLFASDMYSFDPAVGMTVMDVALQYVPLAVLSFMASASRSGANSLINGSGNFVVNMSVALLDAIVLRVGLGLLMGLVMKMGYIGFWYGNYISAFTPLVIGIVFFFTGKWKTRKNVVKD